MSSIKRILNKKSWTGTEVGKVALMNIAHIYKGGIENGKYSAPLVEEEKLRAMVNSLDRFQEMIYNRYVSIHEWLAVYIPTANLHYEHAQLQYKTLSNYITEAIIAEDIYSYIASLPYIITETRYNKLKEEAVEKFIGSSDKTEENPHFNIYLLIITALNYYLDLLATNPRKANPLKKIRQQYISDPITNKLIISKWEEASLDGNYIPGESTKWDFLEQCTLTKVYPHAFKPEEDPLGYSNFERSMEDFRKEFKDLVEILAKDIDKKYGKLFPFGAIQDMTIKDWYNTMIPTKDLYAMNYYDIQRMLVSDVQIFDAGERALKNGVAILRPSDIYHKSLCIDKKGDYVQPDILGTLNPFSLAKFFKGSEHYEFNTDIVQTARYDLYESYYYIKGFNLVIDLIMEQLNIKGLEVFKVNLDNLEEKMQSFNKMVPLLEKHIRSISYDDEQLKERKIKALNEFFYDLDYDLLNQPRQNVEVAKELISSFRAFGEERPQLEALLLTIPARSK